MAGIQPSFFLKPLSQKSVPI